MKTVTYPESGKLDVSQLVLSLFPGIDLLGRGFEAEGFCIVRGPDKLFGGDIRRFNPTSNRFDGIIGGSPCQDFSPARRDPPSGHSLQMLTEFLRVVVEAKPAWFLLENVSRVPDVVVEGYSVQRCDLRASECGSSQSRLRHFQFGSRDGLVIVPSRSPRTAAKSRCCMASEGTRKTRRSFADFCELQGLPRDFKLEGFTVEAKYRAVGNGVPVQMARVVARAIRDATADAETRRITDVTLCVCGCGRILEGRQRSATAGCRKRLQRAKRDGASSVNRRTITAPAMSQKEAA